MCRLQWDEENLTKTEQEKSAFRHVTINEPKTPFIYFRSAEELLGSSGRLVGRVEAVVYFITVEEMPDFTLSYSPDQLQQQRSRANSLQHKPSNSGSDWEESETEHVVGDKNFEQLRSKHYRMGDALRQAKELLRKEGLTDEEDHIIMDSDDDNDV